MRVVAGACLLMVMALSVALQADAELIETPSVDGVTLGSTLATVTAKLGQAKKSRSLGTDSDLGMGELKELQFDGIRVFVNRPKSADDFRVYELRITGSRRRLSNGLSVKMSVEAVKASLGTPEGVEDYKQGGKTLVYLFKDRDGRLLVRVRDGHVVCLEIIEENS